MKDWTFSSHLPEILEALKNLGRFMGRGEGGAELCMEEGRGEGGESFLGKNKLGREKNGHLLKIYRKIYKWIF